MRRAGRPRLLASETGHAIITPLPPSCHRVSALAAALDPRSAPRLARLIVRGRPGPRPVTSWVRAAGVSTEFRRCYTAVTTAGTRADAIYAAESRVVEATLRLVRGLPDIRELSGGLPRELAEHYALLDTLALIKTRERLPVY